MTLAEWLKEHGRGEIAALSRRSGVSMLTIRRVRDGEWLCNRKIAEKLCEATGGAVSAGSMLGLPVDCASDSTPPSAA